MTGVWKNPALVLLLFCAFGCLHAENLRTVLDGTPSAGKFTTSVAIGTDGMPIVSYRGIDAGSPNLSVVHCTAVDCGSHDPITVIDSTAHAFGTSVTIGIDGLPIIAYTGTFSTSVDNLSIVHCRAFDCNVYDTPIVLDNALQAGEQTSVKIGADGLPILAYRGAEALAVVHCSAVDCSTHDPISPLEADALLFPSVAIGSDGLPMISYAGYRGVFELHTTHCSRVDCSGQNTVRILDFREDAGLYNSVTIGADGLPIISYYGGRSGTLDVIHCTLVDCDMQPSLINVPDNDPRAGGYPSIAIGTDGLPIISYEGGGGLSVVHCTSVDCSTHDPITVLDNTLNSGQFTSIAIGVDGLPIVSYAGINDDGSTNLSTVHCANVSCAP